MKKMMPTLWISLLLITACLLTSCNTNESIFGDSAPSQGTAENGTALYESMIRDLEDQILELQQSQYISGVENQKELDRLQELLSQLQKETEEESKEPEQPPSTDTQPPADEAEFLYTTDGNTAVITGYTGTDSHLVIPAVIDGYTVTEIADHAMAGKDLQSVIVSNGVRKIGWFAFQGCEKLLSVTLPTSVQSIGYSAFSGVAETFTLYGAEGSFALQYAQSYGLRYATV